MSPFPGMDPYLESSELWHGFHHHLAEELLLQINPLIVPKYFAEVEMHATVEEIGVATQRPIYPDVSVLTHSPMATMAPTAVMIPEAPIKRTVSLRRAKLRTIHIYLTENRQLVTAIEVLSPVNKRGASLQKYRRKRERLLRSAVHLIELDFLRGGQRPGDEVYDLESDYIVLLNRATGDIQRVSEIWTLDIGDQLPTIPLPLLLEDDDVAIDLAETVQSIYAKHFYGMRIDYSQPVPPLKLQGKSAKWWAQKQVIT